MLPSKELVRDVKYSSSSGNHYVELVSVSVRTSSAFKTDHALLIPSLFPLVLKIVSSVVVAIDVYGC